jgi:hypothetical protein
MIARHFEIGWRSHITTFPAVNDTLCRKLGYGRRGQEPLSESSRIDMRRLVRDACPRLQGEMRRLTPRCGSTSAGCQLQGVNEVGHVRILPLALPAPKLANDVPVRTLDPQHVLEGHESLEPDWPARVDPPRADADLGAKAIAEAVSEARTRVHEDARRGDAVHERAAYRSGLRHDAVGVVRTTRVDVRDRGGERRYGAHGERQREVLGRVGIWWGWQHVCCEVDDCVGVQRRERRLVAEEPHVGRE